MHTSTDPDAELYYNDYSMVPTGEKRSRRENGERFEKRGIRIDAIGMQGHIGMDYPKISEFEKSMLNFCRNRSEDNDNRTGFDGDTITESQCRCRSFRFL